VSWATVSWATVSWISVSCATESWWLLDWSLHGDHGDDLFHGEVLQLLHHFCLGEGPDLAPEGIIHVGLQGSVCVVQQLTSELPNIPPAVAPCI
jgi:hypothetical protein